MVLWRWSRCPSSPFILHHHQKSKTTLIFSLHHHESVVLRTWCILLLLILKEFTGTLTQSTSHHTTHTVNTKYGLIRGIRLQFSSSSAKHLDPVSAYLGIPYASPPINAYRFMPPVAPLPWSPGTRQAVAFSPACPQKFPDVSNRTRALQSMTMHRYAFLLKLIPHLVNQSEDCLYLNVYVPTVTSGEEIRPGKFPIIFVIHGESWEWGSGNEFDGAVLASLGNHIVVTFNYRLGILGFLKTSNQQSNFGLLDVIAALHWVRENGDAFGGDRNRITLLGYRTGAVIANLLLVAQIAKDLFQRAILISGSVLSPWALQKHPEEISLQVSNQLACKGRLPLSHPESDLAPCLRQKHLSELLKFTPTFPRFLSPFAPYIDNVLLRNPKSLMETSEQFLRAQILIIFTTSEGFNELNEVELRHGFESEHRDRLLRTLVRNVFNYHQTEIFSIVRNEYTDWERPILHPIPLRDATVEALSDCLVIAPSIQLALMHSRRDSTYLLHFSHVSREMESNYERLGSLEGDVVPYIIGLPVTNNVPTLGGQTFISPWSILSNFSRQDAGVSETLIHYLANFARNGIPNEVDPNPEVNDASFGSSKERIRLRSLHWEAFDQTTQLYMNLGSKPRLRSHYRGHKLALWLNLIPQIHMPGGSDVAPSHHMLDSTPNLYIGPVRQLYPLSYSDQIPGFGGSYSQTSPAKTHLNPTSTLLPTTECIEPTGAPTFSRGTGLYGIDGGDEDDNRVNNGAVDSSVSRGLGIREPPVPGEQDYSTALTVTLSVGVCLILLNLLVFSFIMCHRKRMDNGMFAESPGSRHGTGGGTPLKSSFQDEYKWMPCSSSHAVNDEEFTSSHLSHPGESIAFEEYSPSPCAQHQHQLQHNQQHQHQHFDSNCCMSPGASLMRPHSSPLMMVMMSGNECPENSGSSRHRVQVQQIPQECMAMTTLNDQHQHQPPLPGSIRLYMNQSAGDILEMPDHHSHSTLPRGIVTTYANTNSLSRTTPSRAIQIQSPSSSGGTTSVSTPNNGGNSSSGYTTLVGVLKRHSSTSTPSSMKKRVQIQEISV